MRSPALYLPMRRPSISEFDLDMAVELIGGGQTAKAVAFAFGHDARALGRALARRRVAVEVLRGRAEGTLGSGEPGDGMS